MKTCWAVRVRSARRCSTTRSRPPTLAWYLSGLVFEWLKEQGGVEAIGKLNEVKKRTLYDFIDASGLYSNPINKTDRSWMNVPFRLADDTQAQGLEFLLGH